MRNGRSTAIRTAIRAELLDLLADGEDFNCDTLGRMRQICDYGAEIIKSIEAPIGAATHPMDLKRAMEASQVAFACHIDDGSGPALPNDPGVTAANSILSLPPALLSEQLPGETTATRLLKELITVLRDRSHALPPTQGIPANGAAA